MIYHSNFSSSQTPEAKSSLQVLIEMSLLGWKEFELEVMRDLADNVVIICSIENIDPMGVHTGDSITTAPAQTLTDKEYQRLRDASVTIIREMGVECGGSNVQMAINPKDGEVTQLSLIHRACYDSLCLRLGAFSGCVWLCPIEAQEVGRN